MLQTEKDIIIFTIAGTAILLLLGIFIVGFLFFYQKRQIVYLKEKERLKNTYRHEILTSKMEIQEHTLNHVAQELHDNIGQVLSFIKLSLGATRDLPDDEKQVRIDESRDLIAHVIGDLRDLSKRLSYETVASKGLAETIRTELERISKTSSFSIAFDIRGQSFPLGQQRELVMFRIFQESLQNILKHSEASSMKINLQYSPELFNLMIHDDGKGFLPEDMNPPEGSGLRNMKNRVKLIGATLTITSSPGKGCIINVDLPIERDLSSYGENPSGSGG